MVGKSIAHFEITAKIGQGGMGEVFLARDTKLDREVALKFLPLPLQQDESARLRFIREAKAAAAIDHPFICSIYEVGETDDGQDFIAMEYVAGQTLQERLEDGPISLEKALPILIEAAEAIEKAHSAGFVHRDLKPANLMLTSEGHVKVMDFGLAKRILTQGATEQEVTAGLTREGSTLGTLSYMSPEQIRGEELDARSDIFSFGLILYETLAGQHPFRRKQPMQTAAAIMNEQAPTLGRYMGDTPYRLELVVSKLVTKEPDRRYQLIHDVKTDLEHLIREPNSDSQWFLTGSTSTRKDSVKPFHLLPWGGLLLVAMIVAGLSGWLLKPHPPAPTPVRLEANVSGEQPLYVFWGNPAALSPDGKLLAFVAGTNVESHLYLRSLERLESELFPGTGLVRAPFFSPDGLWLGFFEGSAGSGTAAAGELKKVSTSGGVPLTLCPVGGTFGATWGAEGTIVFAQASSGLMKVPEAGGTPEELTRMEEGETRHAWPQFLPGGLHVLFVSYTSDGSRIEVAEVQTGKRKVIHEGGRYPRYAASGHLLYVDSGTLFAASFDLQGLEVTAEAVPVLQEVGMSPLAQGTAHYEVCPDGTLVYLRGTGPLAEQSLVWVDEEGEEETPASKSHLSGGISFPRLSPDGQRVALSIISNANSDIWVLDLERDLQTRLTFDEASDGRPVWSSDGSFIYFQSNRSGKYGIFRMPADGSGERELLLESDTPIAVRDVSRDGRYLAYCPSGARTGVDIFLLPLAGDPSPESFAATPADEGSPRFSPDGSWMAYDSDETGRLEVYVQHFPEPGGKFQVSGAGGFRPQWSEDGRRLFYRTDDAIWVSTVEGQDGTLRVGKAKPLVELESIYDRSLMVAPDEKRFLLIRNEQGQTGGSSRLTFVFNWFEELKRLVPTE